MDGPSVTTALSAALEHMQRILFQPFRFKFWLRLGFIIFFIGAGQAGSFNFNKNLGNLGQQTSTSARPDLGFIEPYWESVQNFFNTNQLLFVLLLLVAIAVGITLWLILSYLGSISRFMFVEALLEEDIEIRPSFSNNKSYGFQFWIWTIFLSIGSLLLFSLLGGSIFLSVLLLKSVKVAGILMLIGTSLITLIVTVGLSVFWVYTNRFVPAIMYIENINFTDAWKTLAKYINQYLTQSILFILMLVVLSIIITIMATVILLLSIIPTIPVLLIIGGIFYVVASLLMTMTWNVFTITMAIFGGMILIVGLRYVWAVLLSPLEVFLQSYALAFLDGFNPQWNIDLVQRVKNDYNEEESLRDEAEFEDLSDEISYIGENTEENIDE